MIFDSIHRTTYHIDRRVKAPETSSVQIGRVSALLDIQIRSSELGIVGHQKYTGIVLSGSPGNVVRAAAFIVNRVSSNN
jgi:hypothetical protein